MPSCRRSILTSLGEALALLGALLSDRAQAFQVVVIGGGGLQLIGVIERPTQDVDLVALRDGDILTSLENGLPPALAEAVADVAEALVLDPEWMNGKPSSMVRFGLPDGFLHRLEGRHYGGLHVWLASRLDQIHFKVYAAADGRPQGKHHLDLQRLRPTAEELQTAAAWTQTHDPSDAFAIMLAGVLATFGVELVR